jgi:ketosteroid isomerase-like protein
MFVDAINHQDLDRLSTLMAEKHVFIDSLGMRVEGKAAMRQAWEGYFRMVPDYTVTIQGTFAKGQTVVLLGIAQGTYSANGVLAPENRWSTPAAWRALIRSSSVAEWQVFADNDPIRQIMSRNTK